MTDLHQLFDPIRQVPPGALPPPGAMPFAQNRGGLWLPSHLVPDVHDAPARRPVMMNYVAINAGWKDVTGTSATMAAVLDRLRRYSVAQVLTMVGRLSLAMSLERPYGENRLVGQQRMLARMVGVDVANEIVARVKGELGDRFDPDRVMFFQERQTLNALKLALLVVDLALQTARPARFHSWNRYS